MIKRRQRRGMLLLVLVNSKESEEEIKVQKLVVCKTKSESKNSIRR